MHNPPLVPLPANTHTVSLFVADLYDMGLTASTISSHLSAITYYHLADDHPDPCDSPKLRRMVLGVKKLKKSKDNRLPLLEKHIHLLASATNHVFADNYYLRLMCKTIILLAFFGFFRIGELLPASASSGSTTIQLNHVFIYKKSVQIMLHHSKTNRSVKPMKIIIKKESPHCPVRTLRSYLTIRGSQPGPLFILPSSTPLTIQAFRSHFKLLLCFCNLSPQHYKLHSFRIGACTQAIMSGVSATEVMALGRWKSHAFKRYIRIPELTPNDKRH